MQKVSQAYKNSMKSHLRNRAYIKATVGIINSEAQDNVRADKEMKKRLNVDEGVQKELKKWEQILGETGRILLRPSGTEPLIRVMVEGKDENLINEAAKAIAQSITERLAY